MAFTFFYALNVDGIVAGYLHAVALVVAIDDHFDHRIGEGTTARRRHRTVHHRRGAVDGRGRRPRTGRRAPAVMVAASAAAVQAAGRHRVPETRKYIPQLKTGPPRLWL